MENITGQTPKSSLTGNIVFFLLALFMGIVYFTVTLTCFLLGVGTLVIWIGLPVLFATLYMVHGMAALERTMVSNLLGMPHPDQPYGRAPERGFLRRFGSLLRDPYTWTSMIYMLFIKLPLGIFSFTLVVTLLVSSVSMIFLPLVYLVNLFVDSILISNGVPAAHNILIPYFVEIHGSFDPVMFARSFAGVALGLVLWYATRQIIRWLALFSGILANAMLGPGATAHSPQPHTLNYVPPTRTAEQRVYTGQPAARVAEQRAYND